MLDSMARMAARPFESDVKMLTSTAEAITQPGGIDFHVMGGAVGLTF